MTAPLTTICIQAAFGSVRVPANTRRNNFSYVFNPEFITSDVVQASCITRWTCINVVFAAMDWRNQGFVWTYP
jgi:hypothetical protein